MRPPTNALRPINPDNAWGSRITAAAGTRLAAPYSWGTVICSSLIKAIYTPKGFFWHAASLPHACAHWGIFLTAASRRSLGSVSVPVSRVMLSHPVLVIALVGRYPANMLMRHRPLLKCRSFKWECHAAPHFYRELFPISRSYARLQGRLPMCYAPVCLVPCGTIDLHALDTPPAFILSQDQTLSKIEKYCQANLR